LKIREVREDDMEVQEEAVLQVIFRWPKMIGGKNDKTQ